MPPICGVRLQWLLFCIADWRHLNLVLASIISSSVPTWNFRPLGVLTATGSESDSVSDLWGLQPRIWKCVVKWSLFHFFFFPLRWMGKHSSVALLHFASFWAITLHIFLQKCISNYHYHLIIMNSYLANVNPAWHPFDCTCKTVI